MTNQEVKFQLCLLKLSSRVFWEEENWKNHFKLYFCQKTFTCMYVRVFCFSTSLYIQSSEFMQNTPLGLKPFTPSIYGVGNLWQEAVQSLSWGVPILYLVFWQLNFPFFPFKLASDLLLC
uniref:Uncharacterized protein n=1 Tax=Monodon monoceros TaxID=40151 RepID=A0A8C6FB82_MONMO